MTLTSQTTGPVVECVYCTKMYSVSEMLRGVRYLLFIHKFTRVNRETHFMKQYSQIELLRMMFYISSLALTF